MRYGVKRERRYIVLTAKRNNWRPASTEPELPPCLNYMGQVLTKVGERVCFQPAHPRYRILASFLRGDQPHERALDRAMEDLALSVELAANATCTRLRRLGFDLSKTVIINKLKGGLQ